MTDTQVVIIGGGVMGVSLLYHLTKFGWSDVVLLEKNDLTHGSTWHAAGLCTHFSHNATVQELRAMSVRLYRDILPKETEQSCGFHPSGAMRVTRNPDRMDEFRHVAGLSEFTGYPLDIVTPEQIAELHPLAQVNGLIGGVFEPDDGHVDPTLATHAMARVAQEKGGIIKRFCPVKAIARDGDAWRIHTEDTSIRTQHIVNAAGTWGWEIGAMMGLNIPSVPVLHQYLVTDTVAEVAERIAEGLPELPIIRDPDESWYVRQERDGLILGPYEKNAQVWSVDGVPPEFGADLMPPDLDRVEPIIEAAMARIPALSTGGLKSVINGPITFTPDANPLIGPAQGLPQAWLLTGSSMGVMEGGGAGWFLAHWMTHGAPPMDAIAIDSRRFGKWADRDYRVVKAMESFGLQFGVHYPYEERPAGRNIRQSPLHHLMLERGAVMGAVHGWERPNWFSDQRGDTADLSFSRPNWFKHVRRECRTVSEAVAMSDLSVFSKFRVTGPGTEGFLSALGANHPPKPGRIGLTHALTPAGGVLSEFTVTRLNQNGAYLTSAAAAEDINFDLLSNLAKGHDVDLRNVTSEIGIIALMGPRAHTVLAQVCEDPIDFPWFTHREITIAGKRCLALRMSYIGEAGWELHTEVGDTARVFLTLETAGTMHHIGYFGAFATNAMRLEKGYPAWGSDLTTERSPLEAGLGAFLRESVSLMRKDPWRLVLLEIVPGDVDPFHAHTVWQGERPVGIVTSGAHGHRTGKTLAFAYLRDPGARDGLSVSILGEKRAAVILEEVPFDPGNLRLKDPQNETPN